MGAEQFNGKYVLVDTSDLRDMALNFAVASALGGVVIEHNVTVIWPGRSETPTPIPQFASDWYAFGSLQDKLNIDVWHDEWSGGFGAQIHGSLPTSKASGDTRLIAMCRAIVMYRIGENVAIPKAWL